MVECLNETGSTSQRLQPSIANQENCSRLAFTLEPSKQSLNRFP